MDRCETYTQTQTLAHTHSHSASVSTPVQLSVALPLLLFKLFSKDTPKDMWPDDAESVQQIEDDWVGENGDKRCRTVTRLCSVILLTVLASVLKSISGHLHVLSLICCNAGPTPINDYALTLLQTVCVHCRL